MTDRDPPDSLVSDSTDTVPAEVPADPGWLALLR